MVPVGRSKRPELPSSKAFRIAYPCRGPSSSVASSMPSRWPLSASALICSEATPLRRSAICSARSISSKATYWGEEADVDVDAALGLIVASVAATGLLAGASMDQSIKQLPARRQIGVVAYSDYSRAADLGNGIAWYAALGVGGGLLTLVAAGGGLLDSPPR